MKESEIDFGELLLKGSSSYDKQIASWWLDRAVDQDHQEAYRNIAELLFAHLKLDGKLNTSESSEPKFLVDYACGGGHLFPHLMRLMPEWTFIGIDGSQDLLKDLADQHIEAEIVDADKAFSNEGPQIRLIHSGLPNFDDFQENQADAVLLCFPNLLPDEELLDVFNENGYSLDEDNEIAHCLARYQEMDPEQRDTDEDEEEIFDDLMTARVFSRNLNQLLKPGGTLLRVEYANCHRDELSLLTKLRSFFSEGALDEEVNEEECEAFFSYVKSYYTESPVILDVYHQTGDESDKEGGYCVHLFEKPEEI